MAISREQVNRSLSWLGTGLFDARQRRRQERAHTRLATTIQTMQMKISGVGAKEPTLVDVVVPFDEIAINDPGTTGFDHEDVHFASGYRWISGGTPIVQSSVIGWETDDDGNYTGARVRIQAYDPQDLQFEFSGAVHLTFFTFSVPDDDTPIDDDQGVYDGQP